MYNKKSLKAEEFISHEEIVKTLDYAEKNKDNLELKRDLESKLKAITKINKISQ